MDYPYAMQMVRERVYDPAMWDDCAQEAMIHDWLTRQKHPGHKEAYYIAAVKRWIKKVAMTGQMTGMPSQRGSAIDPMRQRDRVMSLDAPIREDSAVTLMDTLHDYDPDREVIISGGERSRSRVMCRADKHVMAKTRNQFGRCEACTAEGRKKYYDANRDKVNARRRARKAEQKARAA